MCIKLMVSPDSLIATMPNLKEDKKAELRKKSEWVITFHRDHETFRKYKDREVIRRFFDVESNTAYHYVIVQGHRYFAHDNLRSINDHYLNENPRWNEFYNSTMVVPIRYKSDDGYYLCFGLLCADSLNPNNAELYTQPACAHILGVGADLLATFFLLLSLSAHAPTPPDPALPQVAVRRPPD